MRCPNCKRHSLKVTNTVQTDGGFQTRRYMTCKHCSNRYSSQEEITQEYKPRPARMAATKKRDAHIAMESYI